MDRVINVRLRAREGHADEVAALLRRLAVASRREPGSLVYEVSRAEEDPQEFLVYERYQSDAAVTAHQRSDHFQDLFVGHIAGLLEERSGSFFTPETVDASDRGAALVMGGGSGIGRACAERLARVGHVVVVADLRGDAAESVASSIAAAGGQATGVAVDVADVEASASVVSDVEREVAPLAVLVNSAGYVDVAGVDVVTWDQIDRMISVHLRGTMVTTIAAARAMRARGYGRIVNVASVAALKGSPNHSHYAAAKAGIVGFTRSVSSDVAPWGVTVNCVLPGPIDTPLIAYLDDDAIASLAATPVGRIGTPEDVAYAVEFFAGSEASFLTGATLVVAGGSYVR